ncbi:hypothetical protein L0Y34_01435 [Candidatus Parcubacteria bacterium]|nr:hypothetical protein [Candidatus Parcubacteria bacterium]
MDLIKTAIWIVIGLLALSFFGISLRALVETPTTQDNWSFLVSTLEIGWDYIAAWFSDFFSIFGGGTS